MNLFREYWTLADLQELYTYICLSICMCTHVLVGVVIGFFPKLLVQKQISSHNVLKFLN